MVRCRSAPLLAVALLAGFGAAGAGEPATAPAAEAAGGARTASEGEVAARVARLVAERGHADGTVREKATAELRAVGEPALKALDAAARSTDLEVRSRAEDLLRQIARDLAFSRMGNTLIAETYADRVVEVDRGGKEVWVLDGIEKPVVAQRFGEGRTLVAEREGGRVTIFDRDKKPLWKMEDLGHVWHARRLERASPA
jgi:hypothetical protein